MYCRFFSMPVQSTGNGQGVQMDRQFQIWILTDWVLKGLFRCLEF